MIPAVSNALLTGSTRLTGFPSSANLSPKYVVIHYPATDTLASTFNALRGKKSYHLVIDRDGRPHQLVPFDRRAIHAGVSDWKGLSSLNAHAIGISLQNAGRLKAVGDGFKSSTGGRYRAEDVERARPRLPTSGGAVAPWERFTDVQLDTCEAVIRALREAYPGLVDLIGHDEIAMGRRDDPGPLFPWARMRTYFPKAATDFGPRLRVKPAGTTLYKGHDSSFAKAATLAGGTPLHLRANVYKEVFVDGRLVRTERTGWIAVAREASLGHAGFIRVADVIAERAS